MGNNSEAVQLNLFGEPMEGYGAAPKSTPFTSSNSSFISQDMIDCVLRCGSNEPHSLERIISQYQKNKGIDSKEIIISTSTIFLLFVRNS